MQPLARYPLVGIFVVLLLALSACGGGSGVGPPSVTSRVPVPGDDNVSVRDSFVATFSEAVDSSTVNDSSVIVRGSDSALMEKTLSLSNNGTTLTIDLVSNPVVPNDLTVTLTDSITGLSGNPLTLPTTAWTFLTPDWLKLGDGRSAIDGDNTDSISPSLAVDGAENPLVAWREFEDFDDSIHVHRWNGTTWDPLGTRISANTGNTPAAAPSIVVDGLDNPVLAWNESDGTASSIYVHRWDGTAWNPVGTALSANVGSTDALVPSLAIDVSDNPVVAWHEDDGTTLNVYVQRWNGSSWDSLGTALSANGGSTAGGNPSLAIDGADNPVVAWQESDGSTFKIYVRRWNGTAWEALGTFLSAVSGSATKPSLAIDGADNPVIAWQENDDNVSNIYVWRWNGTSWNSLGTALSANAGTTSAINPSLVIDGTDSPLVAWQENDGSSYNLYVQSWNDNTTSWSSKGGGLSATDGTTTSAGDPSLGIDVSGTPIVAWQESDTTVTNIYVRRYNQ